MLGQKSWQYLPSHLLTSIAFKTPGALATTIDLAVTNLNIEALGVEFQ
jgi:hypothetical protein